MAGSRADLERTLQRPVASFAYPFGKNSAQVRAEVAASFELAFTTEPGLNGLQTDPLLLRRTAVGPYERLLDVDWRARRGRPILPWLAGRTGIRSHFMGSGVRTQQFPSAGKS